MVTILINLFIVLLELRIKCKHEGKVSLQAGTIIAESFVVLTGPAGLFFIALAIILEGRYPHVTKKIGKFLSRETMSFSCKKNKET
jgi:multisubunit Na+/H+ antiporter MnhG subunit